MKPGLLSASKEYHPVPSQILRFMLCCIVSFPLLLAPARSEEGHSNIHCVEAAGLPNSPIRLGIHVGPSVKVDEALVVLHDIPAEAKFNIGLDVGEGAWLVPVYALPDLTITMPHRGHVRMTVQLFDAQFTPNSQKVPVHVHIETTTATVGN